MTITLKLDYDGNPYLELIAQDYNPSAECQLLEFFIKQARAHGLHIKTESSYEGSNDYATIRLGCEAGERAAE